MTGAEDPYSNKSNSEEEEEDNTGSSLYYILPRDEDENVDSDLFPNEYYI